MLTPNEVAERTFHTCRFNGYRTEDVDNFMDTLTEDYSNLYKENAVLKSKIKVLVDKISEYRATEDDMRVTLLTARRTAESIVAEAEKEREAKLAGVEDEVAQRRAELQKGLADAEAQLEAAKQSTMDFVRGMRALVQSQFDFLEKLPSLEAEETPSDEVAQTAAAIDDSLNAIYPDGELEEALKAAEEAAAAAPEAAYAQEIPEVETEESEPTRVIDLGSNEADQDYNM